MAKAIDTLSIRLEFKEGSGSQQIIDKIGNSIKKLQVIAGQTGPSVEKVRRSINDFARQGNKSISTIEGQVTALRALRREADINSKEFKELTADIAKYERQLNKAQGRRGGGGARQATQVAGAVISGGIFGGPEGAIGGALGAFGGVQGAFAGAAIGAQVGNVRKSVGDAADYAAQIGKLKIALEGVVPNQDDFNSALETASRATQELNVPQEQAVRGITRLAAAVTGAGGPVGDAETTFKNVTAAIKATGGSSEDVKGAITAMVQVFSKGKVSAEELSGQLGERLPGAVTLFAKANKMTLPELQKNLKAGTVGLNELMKFIEQLGVEFNGTARTIASSNEEAGARLSVAFDEMRASVGDSLLETGANFQNAFAAFITDLTPKVVTGIELIKGSVSGFMKVFLPAAAGITTFILLVKGAAIIATLGGIAAAIVTLALKIKILAAGLATVGILLATNPLFLGIAAVSGIVAGIVAVANATGSQADEVERLNKAVRESKAPVAAGSIDAADRFKKAQVRRGAVGQRLSDISRQLPALEAQAGSATQEEGSVASYEVTRLKNERKQLLEEKGKLDATIRETRPLLKSAQERARDRKATDYGDPSTEPGGDSGGTKSTLENRTKQAQQLESSIRRRLNLAQAEGGLARFIAQQANQRAVLEDKIIKIKEGGTSQEIERATAEARNLQTQEQAAKLKERVTEISKKALKPLQDAVQAVRDQAKVDERIEELIREGINPERAEDIANLEKIRKKAIERLNVEIDVLRAIVGQGGATQAQIDALDELIEKRKEAEGVDPKEETSKGKYDKEKSEFDQFKDAFEDGLNDMMNVGPKLAGVAVNAIGSMTDGLIELITTGKANFKQMAAAILKDIAKIMLQAAIASAVKNLFFAADGAVIQAGQVKPYAKGGVVGGPTVFPMVGNNVGLMGEAGPEAIMPLKRGPGGRLGVEVANQNNPREAMARYSRGSRGSGIISDDRDASASADGGVAVAAPIDVRYTVERINNVEYVTADQFQSGLQRAAQQGAQRGEQNTLKRLQLSSGTRRRVGI